jgi:YD repeat-containing protein
MSSTDTANTQAFDYNASADLFSMTNRNGRRQPLGYRHFESAAEAIRYAVEEIPAQNFIGTLLQVDESRCDSREITRLYASPSFPLARKIAEPV